MLHTNFQNWLDGIIASETPDETIVGYYFGIFKDEVHYTVYLTGSEVYDPLDADWACRSDFEPADKYFIFPGEFDSWNWQEILDEIEKFLNNFVRSDLYLNSFFSTAKIIATGFDDGDLVEICK